MRPTPPTPTRAGLASLVLALATVAALMPFGTAAAGPPVPQEVPAARFAWPLPPPHPVLRRFSAPAAPWGPGHRGVDIAGTPGEPVLAAADGVVVFAGHLVDRGVVSVDHAGGLRTTYEPLSPAVTPGQTVSQGQHLGQLQPGHPGCPLAACLHWGLRRGAEYLDPLTLLKILRVRLLPWPR